MDYPDVYWLTLLLKPPDVSHSTEKGRILNYTMCYDRVFVFLKPYPEVKAPDT